MQKKLLFTPFLGGLNPENVPSIFNISTLPLSTKPPFVTFET
jgi:hypothetical protein